LGAGHPNSHPGAAGNASAQPNAGAGYPQPRTQRYAAAGDRRPGTPAHGYPLGPMAMARVKQNARQRIGKRWRALCFGD